MGGPRITKSTLSPFGVMSRSLRATKSLRLEDVADMLDVTAGYLSAVELGRRPPLSDLVVRLAEKLNLTEAETNELQLAADRSVRTIVFRPNSPEQTHLANLFARKLKGLSGQRIKTMLSFLSEE